MLKCASNVKVLLEKRREEFGVRDALGTMKVASALSRSMRGASHQPVFMGHLLFVIYACPVYLVDGSVFVWVRVPITDGKH